jgi:hypothetical protein
MADPLLDEAKRLSKDLDAVSAALFADERREQSDVIQDAMNVLSELVERVERAERERDEAIKQRDYDYARFTEAKAALLERDKEALSPNQEQAESEA